MVKRVEAQVSPSRGLSRSWTSWACRASRPRLYKPSRIISRKN
jgi:hypothetical protein